jgi:hypothetical protein
MKNKILLIIAKVAVLLLGAYFSFVLNSRVAHFFVEVTRGNKEWAAQLVVSVASLVTVTLYYLLFHKNFLENLYERLARKPLGARIALVVFSANCAVAYLHSFTAGAGRFATDALGWVEQLTPSQPTLLLLFFVPAALFYTFVVTAFTELIGSVFTSLERYERNFLLGAGAVVLGMTIFLYSTTTVYHYGLDTLYSFDSLARSPYLMNPFHDWLYYRFPMQADFTMPFMLFTQMFAFSALANLVSHTVIPFFLLLIAFVMVSRMVSVKIYAVVSRSTRRGSWRFSSSTLPSWSSTLV